MRTQRLVLGLILATGTLLIGAALWMTLSIGSAGSPGSTDPGADDRPSSAEATPGSDRPGELPAGEPAAPVTTHRERVDRTRGGDGAVSSTIPRTGQVRGRVETLYGDPLPGAEVEIIETTSAPSWLADPSVRVVTDGEGQFVSAVPLGALLRITARAEDHVPQTQYGISSGDEVVFVLEDGVRLTGVVIDDESGLPVAGARLTTRVGPTTVEARTGADGHFELTDLAAGSVTVRVVALGYERAEYRNLAVGQSSASLTELRLVPGQLLAGVVIDAARGAAIGGAEVTYGQGDSAWSLTRLADPTGIRVVKHTDEGGGFVFDRVGVEDAWLRVEAEGHAPRTLRGNELAGAGADTPLEVRLTPAARLEGIVFAPDGSPVAGASVDAPRPLGSPILTGEDGRFLLDGLDPAETIRIVASHPLYAPTQLDPMRVDEVPQPVELTLVAPASIAGQVLDGTGAPAAGLRVTLTAAGRGRRLSRGFGPLAVTDQDGRFSYQSLTPGDYQVSARGTRWLGEPVPVVLEAGQTCDVVISALPALAVTGLVLDASGQPLPGVRLDATESPSGPGGSTGFSGSANVKQRRAVMMKTFRTGSFSDHEGRFELVGFAPGTRVKINAHRPGYASTMVDTQAGASDLMIVVERYLTFEGRVVDTATQRPIASFAIELSREGGSVDRVASRSSRNRVRFRRSRSFSNPEGIFVLDRLVAGSYRIRARSPDHRVGAWTPITVADNQGTGTLVTLSLVSATIVKGRIYTVDGVPARRVNVFLAPARSAGGSTRPSRGRRRGGTQVVRADGDGVFRFREMRPGLYDLGAGSVDDPVAGPVSITAVEGGIVEQDLRLPPLPSLEVTVTDSEGQAVERAAVRLRMVEGLRVYYSGRTDAKGIARFENLLPGEYTMSSYSRQGRSGERRVVITGAGTFREVVRVTRGSGR